MRYVKCESFFYTAETSRSIVIAWQTQLSDNSKFTCMWGISHYLSYEIFNLKLWFENNLHRLSMDFLSIRVL